MTSPIFTDFFDNVVGAAVSAKRALPFGSRAGAGMCLGAHAACPTGSTPRLRRFSQSGVRAERVLNLALVQSCIVVTEDGSLADSSCPRVGQNFSHDTKKGLNASKMRHFKRDSDDLRA